VKFRNVNYRLNFQQFIWLVGLGVLPFWYWPWSVIPFEIPKVWLFSRWVEVLVLMGIWYFMRGKRLRHPRMGVLWLVVLFVGIAILSSLLGVGWEKSVFGNYYRADGLLTLFHLSLLSVWLMFFWRKEWEASTIRVLGWGSLGVAGLAVSQKLMSMLGLFTSGWGDGSVGATFGQPNFLGGYLVVTLPFFLKGIYERSGKPWRYVWLALYFGGLATTQARSAMVLALLFMAMWGWRQTKLSLVKVGLLGVLVAGIGWGAVILAGEGSVQPEGRARIVARALGAARERPLLGWGYANVDKAVESVVWPMPYLHDVYVDKAHGLLLEYAVTMGVVGLGVYGGLAWVLFVSLIDKSGRGEKGIWRHGIWLSVLGLYLLHSQTNVISINEEMLFWLTVGIVGSGEI
jgi:O-antigen ligase